MTAVTAYGVPQVLDIRDEIKEVLEFKKLYVTTEATIAEHDRNQDLMLIDHSRRLNEQMDLIGDTRGKVERIQGILDARRN